MDLVETVAGFGCRLSYLSFNGRFTYLKKTWHHHYRRCSHHRQVMSKLKKNCTCLCRVKQPPSHNFRVTDIILRKLLIKKIYSYGFWPKQFMPKEEKKNSTLHVQKENLAPLKIPTGPSLF